MFCPGCGLQEIHSNQFCRACGTDLRPVRCALARPDSVTASAAMAREEIGRAVAAKIRETRSVEELAEVAEEVLPEIEKFLESPEEKRMRRVRSGMVVSFVGLGATVGFFLASVLMGDNGIFFFVGLGFVAFFVGLGLILNGLLFTIPRKALPADKTGDAEKQHRLDAAAASTSELALPASNQTFSSVTERTTHQLKEKQPVKS